VRTRVETFTRLKSNGAEAVEKDERSDHAAMHGRQGAAHLEAIAEIANGRQNDLFDFGGIGLNGHGIVLSSSGALCEDIEGDFPYPENWDNMNRNVRGNRNAIRSRDPDA
jgi:hypothetical protein